MNNPDFIIVTVDFNGNKEDFELPVSSTLEQLKATLETAFTVAFRSLISLSSYSLYLEEKRIPFSKSLVSLKIRNGTILCLR